MAQLIIPKEQESTDFFYFAEQTSPDAEDVKSFDFSTKKAGSIRNYEQKCAAVSGR